MTSGDSDVFVVTKGDTGEGVVGEIRTLLGPKDVSVAKEEDPESLRALYGTDTTMNALHAADSGERAARYGQKIARIVWKMATAIYYELQHIVA